jgi:glycosyltransferase involved in cell wall biosynthesis
MIFSVVYLGVFFGIFTVLLFFLFKENWQKTVAFPEEKVPVSILIAARNEEQNILHCLQAITRLNYPEEKLEVLIGDDHSTDQTYQMVAEFIQDKPNFRLIKIGENLGQAKGKANVLAYLTKEANSNYFFITDADIEVPENWVSAMLARLTPQTGIVTGITTTKGNNFFSRMQGLDWLNAL